MGRITQKSQRSSTDQEETAKPRRKVGRKRDRIHSKILRARRKLDNVKKGDNRVRQKKQVQAKICDRLLPEPATGIYRNGAKGKNIQKETLGNTFRKARLKADALKLFNGDTHGSKCTIKIPTHDETVEQSPNKDYIKNSLEWTPYVLEQSPILGKKPNQNQKLCLIKKKGEENIFEDTDTTRIKQNVNNESRHGQKEDTCKRRLFQNDEEQLTVPTISHTQIFDTDLTKKNKVNEKETGQMCSKKSKDSSCDPLNLYKEFCRTISAENFETDFLPNHSDPVTTTIKRLKQAYANSFRQQLLRKKNKQKLENVESAYSVEYQTCNTASDISLVEFEVPKCSEKHIIAVRPQEGLSSQKNDKFYIMQNTELKKSDGVTRYSPTSCSSRHTFAIYNTNSSIVENCENNDTQCSKSKDIGQLSKSTSFYFINDNNSTQLASQKNSSHVNHLSKSERHDIDHFSIDIHGYKNLRCIDNSNSEIPVFFNDSISEKHFSKDYSREKLPIVISDNRAPNNVSQKCNNRATNKCNVKNVKRVPTILRRFVQITDDSKGLHKKCETNLFNRNSSNDIEKELYENTFPNRSKNLSMSSTVKTIFDQTKVLEPQIGSMKIKDSQESQVEQFDINVHSKGHNGRNEFYDNFLYPQTSETLSNTNVYSKKLPQQEEISHTRKHLFHSNNYRPTNYFQDVSFSNSNVEPTKEFPQQTKLHVCETNKQSHFKKKTYNKNQDILFNKINDSAMPMPISNFPRNIQTEKKSTESCQENLRLFDKTDIECAKNQINRNSCHEQYIYFNSPNCPHKFKEQVCYLKETAPSERDVRGDNNNIDNCVNLSSTVRNVPLLSLKQNNNLYAYPNAPDDQHRAVLLQNVTQPVKYLAVKNGSDMQRIPVYINDRNVRVAENVPLKVIALMDPSTQIKAFPQEIVTQVVPLQTDNLHFNDFTTRKINDQSFAKHLDSVNAILFNPGSQSNIWYTSNL